MKLWVVLLMIRTAMTDRQMNNLVLFISSLSFFILQWTLFLNTFYKIYSSIYNKIEPELKKSIWGIRGIPRRTRKCRIWYNLMFQIVIFVHWLLYQIWPPVETHIPLIDSFIGINCLRVEFRWESFLKLILYVGSYLPR